MDSMNVGDSTLPTAGAVPSTKQLDSRVPRALDLPSETKIDAMIVTAKGGIIASKRCDMDDAKQLIFEAQLLPINAAYEEAREHAHTDLQERDEEHKARVREIDLELPTLRTLVRDQGKKIQEIDRDVDTRTSVENLDLQGDRTPAGLRKAVRRAEEAYMKRKRPHPASRIFNKALNFMASLVTCGVFGAFFGVTLGTVFHWITLAELSEFDKPVLTVLLFAAGPLLYFVQGSSVGSAVRDHDQDGKWPPSIQVIKLLWLAEVAIETVGIYEMSAEYAREQAWMSGLGDQLSWYVVIILGVVSILGGIICSTSYLLYKYNTERTKLREENKAAKDGEETVEHGVARFYQGSQATREAETLLYERSRLYQPYAEELANLKALEADRAECSKPAQLTAQQREEFDQQRERFEDTWDAFLDALNMSHPKRNRRPKSNAKDGKGNPLAGFWPWLFGRN